MKKRDCIVASLLAFVMLALVSVPARAQNATDDFGTWTSLQVVKSFGAPYVMARLEHRSYRNVTGTESWFVMAGGGFNFTKWLKGDLSYEFWKIPSAENITQHKGVLSFTETLRRDNLAFALREKYEFAYIPEKQSFRNTLRIRLRGQYTIPESIFTPYLMYEFFSSLDGRGWIRSLHYAGMDIALGKGHFLDFFYMYHLYGTSGPNGSRHLLGLGYTFAF
ncbi:MAG: DUF2490 domain-containing protein [Bacteroidales bacterium]|nr:DUF2490 domain-containing protein [Bacteroidales bacterium]